MIKDKDFRFCFGENLANIGIDHLEGDDTLDDIGYYINIMTGEFSGIDFKYGKVSFSPPEENTDGDAFLGFEYDVINTNGFENLEENIAFKNCMGDILVTIITEAAATRISTDDRETTEELNEIDYKEI